VTILLLPLWVLDRQQNFIIENLPGITGGARGLTGIPPGSSFLTVLIIVVVVIWILRNFLRSKQGRNCVAVREDELAAASIGTKVASYKALGHGDQLRAVRSVRCFVGSILCSICLPRCSVS